MLTLLVSNVEVVIGRLLVENTLFVLYPVDLFQTWSDPTLATTTMTRITMPSIFHRGSKRVLAKQFDYCE